MKTVCKLGVLILAAAFAVPANARDDRLRFPIQSALTTPDAKERLDRSVRLHFGGGWSGSVAKDYGIWATNKKSNATFRSDQTACEWAFLSAVLELQERARKMGGNAVVDIHSNYKNVPMVSSNEYTCGAGNIMAGVALKGRLIRVGN